MSWLAKLETKDLHINRIPDESGFIPANAHMYRNDFGLDANVVMGPVNWILRNFTEAEPVVERRTGKVWNVAEDHELTRFLEQPNPFYDGDLMTKALLVSYLLDGNAYLQKVRNGFGEVLGYWYLPHFLVEPKWPREDPNTFISHYEYRPDGVSSTKVDLPVRDVVHVRFGLDPRNVRKGLSPLRPILREVLTDEEASTFSAAILRNMGIPGGVIAPKDAASMPNQEDVQAMKDYMRGFTGTRRGEWLVLGTPTEVNQFGFNPQNLMLGNLRDIAEERVCVALGIPAAVVGFGAGLQQTKVGATMRELRRLAWVSCIIPQQKSIAKQFSAQMLPDFVSQTRRFRVRFDASQVAAFGEEETEKAKRVALLVKEGLLRVDRGQEMLGLEVDESQAIYLRPSTSVAVPEGEAGVVEDDEIPAAVASRLNGNGRNPDEG